MNTGAAHGSALGADELSKVKEILSFDPAKSFAVDDGVLAHTRRVGERARETRLVLAGVVRSVVPRQSGASRAARADGAPRAPRRLEPATSRTGTPTPMP